MWCDAGGGAPSGAAGFDYVQVPHHAGVGVLEDVTVVHPHAGRSSNFTAIFIAAFDGTLTVSFHSGTRASSSDLEEEAVQVERVREVGVVDEIPDLRLAEPRLERLRVLVAAPLKPITTDLPSIAIVNASRLLLRARRRRSARSRAAFPGSARASPAARRPCRSRGVLARPIERGAVAAIERHPCRDLVTARAGRPA